MAGANEEALSQARRSNRPPLGSSASSTIVGRGRSARRRCGRPAAMASLVSPFGTPPKSLDPRARWWAARHEREARGGRAFPRDPDPFHLQGRAQPAACQGTGWPSREPAPAERHSGRCPTKSVEDVERSRAAVQLRASGRTRPAPKRRRAWVLSDCSQTTPERPPGRKCASTKRGNNRSP